MDPYYQRYFPKQEIEPKRRSWSENESSEFRRLLSERVRPSVIAKTLGRSMSSLYSRAEKEGIQIPLRNERWSRAELETLGTLVEAGKSNKEIRSVLPHRTPSSIGWHVWAIGGRKHE